MDQSNTLLNPLPWYNRFSDNILKILLKKRLKQVRSKNYPLLACVPSDAIGQWIVMHGLYEEKLLLSLFGRVFGNLLSQFREKTVIDGGANIGNHALFFARYFRQVIAFEPNPSALKLLDANIFFNNTRNIHVIPIGLSNRSAILPFFEDPKNLGGSGFNFNILLNDKPRLKLNVEKGDKLLEKHAKSAPIALIKLDIEGDELNALEGLEETITNYQPIILFETHTSKGKKGSKAIFNYLNKHTYTYFYTAEHKKPHTFFLVKLFENVKGYPIVLNRINEPEDRYYSLIIATTSPLSINYENDAI